MRDILSYPDDSLPSRWEYYTEIFKNDKTSSFAINIALGRLKEIGIDGEDYEDFQTGVLDTRFLFADFFEGIANSPDLHTFDVIAITENIITTTDPDFSSLKEDESYQTLIEFAQKNINEPELDCRNAILRFLGRSDKFYRLGVYWSFQCLICGYIS